jgi:tetratricopeptide (TPR) repeat protein
MKRSASQLAASGGFRPALAAALALLMIHADAQTPPDPKCTGMPGVPWTEQIVECTKAIESGKYADKDLAKAHAYRGNAYAQTGDTDRALADIEQAIRIDPKGGFAYGARGDLYLVKKDYEHAISDYSTMIAVDPTNALAFTARGIGYWASGDLDRAMADFEYAVELQPTSALPLYWRGMARRAKGDTAAGEADMAAAKKINPAVDR